jgi:hypothetical protein
VKATTVPAVGEEEEDVMVVVVATLLIVTVTGAEALAANVSGLRNEFTTSP